MKMHSNKCDKTFAALRGIVQTTLTALRPLCSISIIDLGFIEYKAPVIMINDTITSPVTCFAAVRDPLRP